MNKNQWAIKTLVPEEVYTDREEFLDYFYQTALKARHRRTMSTVLLGQRRMGKTEIFKRVVNRLFFEQDYTDPKAVVPIYYSFPENVIDRWDFAEKYVENAMRWYAAFRLRNTEIFSQDIFKLEDLIEIIRNNKIFNKTLKATTSLFEGSLKTNVILPEEWALSWPRRVSDREDSTIVVFLDEFQNTRLPQYNFDIVGFMQEAVESPTCPHFVTGSAMSILAREILGRGALFGRFRSKPIKTLTGYWGAELTRKVAKYYQVEIKPEMPPIVAERCGGNPFYISAVIQQAAEQNQAIFNEEILNSLLAIDLSSGFIWNELSDQVNRWLDRINDYGITKWILYLSALEEGEEIDIQRIQKQLLQREGKSVAIETIREVLVKLSRGDLIDYKEFGGWFGKVSDPILLEFLKVWGRIEVERQDRGRVKDEFRQKYNRLRRQISDLRGYLAEVYMAQVLHNAQRKLVPKQYFNSATDVKVPDFTYIRLRERFGPGANTEIDVHGGAGIEQWVAESKWQQGRKVGIELVKQLIDKANVVKTELNADLVRIWFFSHDGFTPKAQKFMREKGIFWSTREDLDALLDYVKLRRLPSF